ncbi:energy transducer TonB [Magnetospirillum sp. UT-4]|uniref:energy transducer TonB n=1 Tax=Magnetospirillum sp. UT-4 TaxID=2681467 RepID=UPI0013864F87|nr:energy transducer TonB [Magnetospirillum sp. UT-4]CAA7622494.1 Outer membrane transport energization protein TonB [Magnetospirillum sp. UT-4]
MLPRARELVRLSSLGWSALLHAALLPLAALCAGPAVPPPQPRSVEVVFVAAPRPAPVQEAPVALPAPAAGPAPPAPVRRAPAPVRPVAARPAAASSASSGAVAVADGEGGGEPAVAAIPQAAAPPDRPPTAMAGNPPPLYPNAARRRGQGGTVRLRLTVDPSGAVSDVTVVSGSGLAILDEAAATAVLGWRFLPAIRDGSAVAAELEVPVTFRLEPGRG